MRNKLSFFSRLSLLVLACIPAASTQSRADTFSYPDFRSQTGLILQGFTAPFEGKMRLTPAAGGKGRGGLWRETKQSVKDGFETTFQIQITDKYVHGADGIAFAIENNTPPQIGLAGGNICYGGLTNLLVVKFDNYHWQDHTYGSYDEIAVLAASTPTTPLWDAVSNTLASVTNHVVFSDGAVNTAKIVYVPGNLRVYLDDLENPLMTVYVNLAREVDLDEGRAWVGFTAATGADWQNQDVVSWSFASDDTASRLAREMARMRLGNDPLATPAPSLFASPDPATPGATPLAIDGAFGYSLPGNVALTHGIEASTDLIHWTPLTNALLYFRDPDSANYTRRFYRFPEH
jgi:hypothetical protein